MHNRWIKLISVCSMLGLALSACGGGGGGGVAASFTKVFAADGNIVGALVKDAAGATAADLGGGAYSFAANYVVTLPITVRSRNTAATIAACMDTLTTTVCDPVNILTFQDLDGSGTWTTGDVMYNGGMDIHSAPTASGSRIYANPISALIPAGGAVPAGGVIGLTQAQVLAGGSGDFNVASAAIRTAGAQLVAVQEALVNTGADPAAVATWIASVVANATGTSLVADLQAALTLPGGTAASTLFPAPAVPPSQADLKAAVGNIATNVVAAITGAAAGSVNYEAIISTVQQVIPANSTAPAPFTSVINQLANIPLTTAPLSLISSTNYNQQSSTITTAVVNQTSGLAAVVNPLFIMPVYDLGTKQTGQFVAGPPPTFVASNVTVLDGYTGFSLTYNAAANTITINGTNSPNPGSPAIAGQVLTFDATQQMYGVKAGNLFVSVNLNFLGTKVLSVCNDYNAVTPATPVCTLNHFALPTQAQICAFTFADGSFFAAHTLPTVSAGLTSEYGAGKRFTTMNGQTSFCP